MTARIYQKSKTAMQSGVKNSGHWILEFEQNDAKPIDPLMNWVGSDDTFSQVSMNFNSKESAIDFAKKNKVQKFLFASSCSVYGFTGEKKLVNEKSKSKPISEYAKSKVIGEKIVLKEKNKSFIVNCLRKGTLYGPSP